MADAQEDGAAPKWDGSIVDDRTRERTGALHQLLLGGVVLALTVLIVASPFQGDLGLYFAGVVIVFVLTGVTVTVPWNRISPAWLAVVPALDIVAVGIMRESNPAAGFGLLWVFPIIWLSAGFGLAGLIGGLAGIAGVFWVQAALDARQDVTYMTMLLALVIAAVAATNYLTSRRFAAQRMLLGKQAQLLSRLLERTRRQEQELTEVLDTVDFGVMRMGADGAIAVTNEAHGRLQLATGGVAAYGDDGTTPLPNDELPIERVRRGEAFDSQLVWFGEPNGERRALSVSARRLVDTRGTDAGAVLISRDVTMEVLALKGRDDLVASVTHELRTPLTSILGYLELAIDDRSMSDTSRGYLQIAERNAERLLGIIADILSDSQVARGSAEFSVHPEDTDVVAIVRASVESLLPRAAERAILVDLSGLEPARAQADPLRLRQVIDNLVSNAIKFNPEGGTVTVGSRTDAGSVWIIVRDTGIGVTEEEQASLFQRFYRARSARTTGTKGTGLGLAISREIVRAHGGDITVRSTPGVGSAFIVRLPIAASDTPDTEKAPE